MSAALDYLTAQGLNLHMDGGRLRLSPASRLTDETRQWVRQHKAELLAELQQGPTHNCTGLAPHTLLVRVANLLGVPRGYLLEQGFLDAHDLEEQAHADPLAIAALIRTSPRWSERDRSTGLSRIKIGSPSPEKRTNTPEPVGQGAPQAHATHWSAAIASPEWLHARDAFHNHLAACPACWAPTGRYCPQGQALHQHYQSQPKETHHE